MKSRCGPGLRPAKLEARALPGLLQLLGAAGVFSFGLSQPGSASAFKQPFSFLSFLSLIRTLVRGFGAHLSNPGCSYLEILNDMGKTLFSN